jgi:hypothetical protein
MDIVYTETRATLADEEHADLQETLMLLGYTSGKS